MATATVTAHTGNRNLSTDPKRMAVINVWDSLCILGQSDIRECFPFLINYDNII